MSLRMVEGFEQPGFVYADYAALPRYDLGGHFGFLRTSVVYTPLSGVSNGSSSWRMGRAVFRLLFPVGVTLPNGGVCSILVRALNGWTNNGVLVAPCNAGGERVVGLDANGTGIGIQDFRVRVGATIIGTTGFMDLITWSRVAIAWEVAGLDVTRVRVYLESRLVFDSGVIAVTLADAEATQMQIAGGVSTAKNNYIDSITVWDDPVGDLAAAAGPHWVTGMTVNGPAAPTQGDWSSYNGANSPDGNIDTRLGEVSTDTGAQTTTANSALLLDLTPLPAAPRPVTIQGISLFVRSLSTLTLPSQEAGFRSGAVPGPKQTMDMMTLDALTAVTPLDPATGLPWTVAAVDAATMELEATL